MIRLLRAIRRWPGRVVRRWLTAVLDAFGFGELRVIRNSVSRTRRLQRRAAQQAYRHPFTAPRRQARHLDRGFQ